MELTAGYKISEVGLIPNEWDSLLLGKIGDVKMCKRIFKHQTKKSGDIPFYKIGTFGGEPDAFISQELFNEYREKFSFPKIGDILISASGTIGRTVVYNGEPAYFQDSNIIWISNNETVVSNEYLYHFYKITKWAISDGGVIDRLYNSNVKNKIYISVPSIPEQNFISKALNDFDELLITLENLIKKKNNLKQAILQKLLTGKKRLSGFNDEWKLVILKDMADILKGKGLSKSLITDSGTHNCILYGELFTIYTQTIQKVVSKTNSNEGLLSVEGDILLPGSTTTTGVDLATASVLPFNNIALGGDIIIVRRKSDNYDPVFLAYYLTFAKKREIVELTQGTTIYHLYGKDLKKLSFKIPSLKEQKAIASILFDLDSELLELQIRKKKTIDLKKGLTRTLLTGKRRLFNKEKIHA